MLKLGNHEDISNREMNIFKYINSKEENNNTGFRIKIEKVKYKTYHLLFFIYKTRYTLALQYLLSFVCFCNDLEKYHGDEFTIQNQ